MQRKGPRGSRRQARTVCVCLWQRGSKGGRERRKPNEGTTRSCALLLFFYFLYMHLFPPSTSDSVPVSRPRQKVAVQQRAQHVVQDTIRDKHPPETEPTRPPGVPSWALGGLLLALLFQQAQRHVPVERGAGRAEEAGGDLRRVSCCDFCVYVHLFVRRACLSVGRMRMCTYGDAHATTGTCTRAPGRAPPGA